MSISCQIEATDPIQNASGKSNQITELKAIGKPNHQAKGKWGIIILFLNTYHTWPSLDEVASVACNPKVIPVSVITLG